METPKLILVAAYSCVVYCILHLLLPVSLSLRWPGAPQVRRETELLFVCFCWYVGTPWVKIWMSLNRDFLLRLEAEWQFQRTIQCNY